MRKFKSIALILLASGFLSACKEPTVTAEIVGYNHTSDRPIYIFTVNGAMGPNVMPLSGGGSHSCCVALPEKWHPGLHAKIQWEYDRMTENSPQLPPQSVEIEIPKYERPGNFHVHFYDNHKIKVVISSCSAEHPFYPMDAKSLLPWKADRSKEDYLKYENPKGDGNVC